MGHGLNTVYYKTMTSGTTTSSGFDLGRAFQNVYLEIPTMASGTDFYIQGSSDGTTFRRLMHPAANSSSVQVHTFVIGSAATNRMVPIPNAFRYFRVELSTAMTDTVSVFKIICGD